MSTDQFQPQDVTVPFELLQKLAPAAEQLGISLPGFARFAPTINVGNNIRMLALDLGRLISKQDIFIKPAGTIVTVDAKTGDEKLMTPRRLPDWAEHFCEFLPSAASRRVRNSLAVEDAAQILETDTFRGCLRPLAGVNKVRLPVMRPPTEKESLGTVEFLPPGYDPQSQIFTADVQPYPMDWTVDQAKELFVDVFSEMPWVRPGTESAVSAAMTSEELLSNRSFLVVVMAMVGTYCGALFPPGTLRPMIAIFGNKPGTGKTRLAEAILMHVWGFVAATGAPKDEEKMDVKLEAVAQSLQPWVIFDDIGGSLRSNSLNRFITETMHSGRPYHSNSEFFKVPNVTQVFVTANELPGGTAEDLDRRALIVELFLAEEVRYRKFKRVITSRWLALPETRAKFLAACCALVRNWMSGDPYPAMMLHPHPLETFEDWSAVMGGIMGAADMNDPLSPPERIVGGSTQEDEIKQLLIKVASTVGYTIDVDGEPILDVGEPLPSLAAPKQLLREDLVNEARRLGLLEDLVGVQGSAPLDDTMNKRFGRRMQRWRGQQLRDEHGRLFQFSHKRKKSGATYPLAFL